MTTSSCSGRVLLTSPKNNLTMTNKKGGDWIFSTHEIPKIEEILNLIQNELKKENFSIKLN